MTGFSYGKTKAMEEKRKDREDWEKMKPDFMIDFYLRKGMKGKTPEEILDFLKYGEILYREVNDLDNHKMLRVLMQLADYFDHRVSCLNSRLIKEGCES